MEAIQQVLLRYVHCAVQLTALETHGMKFSVCCNYYSGTMINNQTKPFALIYVS